jgi:hypothetical protein
VATKDSRTRVVTKYIELFTENITNIGRLKRRRPQLRFHAASR